MIENDDQDEKEMNINFYDDFAMRKAVLLCKYVDIIKKWIKEENDQQTLSINKKK